MALEDTGSTRIFLRQGWTGAFSDKPTNLYTNAPYAEDLKKIFRKKPFHTNVCRPLANKDIKWVTGNQYMQQSAVYPIEFCHIVCHVHHRWTVGLKHELFAILKLVVWPRLAEKSKTAC